MFSPLTVAAFLLAYVALLFAAALAVERKSALAGRLVASPLAYSLSLAVYCTSWTFYGSVGKAAQSGLLFLTVYLGPACAAVLWSLVLTRFVRAKNAFHITSIADFISARFGKSQGLAALASIMALIGTTPYVALQLKAIISTFAIITSASPAGATNAAAPSGGGLLAPAVAVFMILFTIIFGARRLDPTERHPGMVAAVVVESCIKLFAFLALGVFITYFVNDGFAALFERAAASPLAAMSALGGSEPASYMVWTSYMILSASAIMFLPRQFHMAVVENSDIRHIRQAMWMLPLYFLLINIFVLPIALDGLLSGLPRSQADAYVLRLPLLHGAPWLALLVFIGGFSAAAGMVMVSTMTLATMAANHLMLPLVHRFESLSFLRQRLLPCRWAAVAGVILLAYAFERQVGESYMLVNIGMISFAAALQFAPAALGAVFWRQANKIGAFLGLGGGFCVWAYAMLLPALVKSGWLPLSLLDIGPFGLTFLRPEALFGLTVLDPLSNAVFWSMFVNIGLFAAGSLLFGQNEEERVAAEEFTAGVRPSGSHVPPRLERNIPLDEKRYVLVRLFGQYLPGEQAAAMADAGIAQAGLSGRDLICVTELADLRKAAERALSGSIGAASAHRAVSGGALFTPAETRSLSDIYGRILANLKLPPEELLQKIDFHQEREELIRRHSMELEKRVAERTRDLAEKAAELEEANRRLMELDRLKSSFLSSVSHELRTPLTSILGFTKLIAKDFRKAFRPLAQGSLQLCAKAERVANNLDIIEQESHRLTRLINDVLDLSKIEEGRNVWRDAPTPVHALIEQAVSAVSGDLARKPELTLSVDPHPDLPSLNVDRDRVLQVLINILNNALKFTVSGRIEVGAAVTPEGGVRLSVADTGPGIPEKDRKKIFDKFFQVVHGDTLMNKPRGTGLGLSICKQILEHYRGSIWVEPREGPGSIFIVEFPASAVAPGEPEEVRPVRRPSPAPQRRRERPLALVVDDDPNIRSYLAQIIEGMGLESMQAADGREALAMASDFRPDIVTMDLMMPGMDGKTCIAAMKRDPDLRDIPIVVVSILSERMSAGGDAAFAKPIDEERLTRTIKTLILHEEKRAFTVLRAGEKEVMVTKKMALCPTDLAFCDAPELVDHIKAGFTGAIIVRGDAVGELDPERLAANPDIQVIILPDHEF